MKKTALTLAATLAFSLGAVGQVQAGALASSVVEFTNFEIFLASSGTQVDTDDLGGTSLQFTNSADVSASLNGVNGAGNGSSTGTPLDLYSSVGVDTSTATGNGVYDNNDFSLLSSGSGLPGTSGNFAISDVNESGFPVTGLGIPTNADVQTASYVSLSGSGVGSSQSNNELTASFQFTSAVADVLRFEFDVATFVEAFLSAGDAPPSVASAGWSIVMTLEDLTGGTFLLNFDESCGVSRTAPFGANGIPTHGVGSGACGFSGVDIPLFTTGALVVGNTYQFTASILTRADAEFVPEPSIIALMGLGLLSLVGFGRRKKGFAA